MIVRVWRGWTRAGDADAYAAYMRKMALGSYSAVPGNLGAYMTRRPDGEREEFAVFSIWQSRRALVNFAGPDPARAVFLPDDDRYLVDREWTVRHYDVLGSHLDL